MRNIMRCWCWIKFRYLKEAGEMQRRCSGSFLPGACSRCSQLLKKKKKKGPLSTSVSWEKRMTSGKIQKGRKKLQQCMLKIATSMFLSYLFEAPPRDRERWDTSCMCTRQHTESQTPSYSALLQVLSNLALSQGCADHFQTSSAGFLQ